MPLFSAWGQRQAGDSEFKASFKLMECSRTARETQSGEESGRGRILFQTWDTELRGLFYVKVDLACRLSQHPSVPPCYRVWLVPSPLP